jgi:hypothetical protein
MDYSAQSRERPQHRAELARTRTGYILAVSSVLALVTFTLVYLATFSYTLGF